MMTAYELCEKRWSREMDRRMKKKLMKMYQSKNTQYLSKSRYRPKRVLIPKKTVDAEVALNLAKSGPSLWSMFKKILVNKSEVKS